MAGPVRIRTGGARLVVFAALGLALIACKPGGGQERGVRTAASWAVFDGRAAYALLERQVAFGPRVPGSPGHAAQLEWMREYLRPRADTLEVQRFTHRTSGGDTIVLYNLFARFRPSDPTRLLFVAHWDTRPTADEETDPERRREAIPGANDGASGVAVLLHLADVLSRHSPPIGVDILLVDGEDYGPGEMYLGSTYFANHLPPGYRPLYGVVVDMVADLDPLFPEEGYSRQYAPEVVDRVWRAAAEIGYGHRFRRSPGPYVMDDHVPLNRAGIPTVDIIDFEYGPGNRYWHTLDDVLENTGPEGLEAVGRVLLELIRRGG